MKFLVRWETSKKQNAQLVINFKADIFTGQILSKEFLKTFTIKLFTAIIYGFSISYSVCPWQTFPA